MIEYRMKCSGCGYEYGVEVEGCYEVEVCSRCGYKGKFSEFVISFKEVEGNELQGGR